MKNAIPSEALAQHIAFLGKTGSGKTSTAKLAIEQILRDDPKARVCILDPIKSDWWGLTSSASGDRAGLPFHILGGPHGHVPLHESAGQAIGEIVGSGALPLSIIDMADFGLGGLQRFFNDFAPALIRKARGVVYLVLEEAHEFAPKERAGHEGESMTLHFAKKLATAGRSKGIRLMVLTQRTQALHNALLGSCDTMIAHRLTAPADQKPVKDWLKGNMSSEAFEKVAGSLASLKTGTGWICSGEAQLAELTAFPPIKTYDNSRTPTGDEKASKVKTAPVDQDKLRTIIGDAVTEAKANDPAELKKRIAELEAEVAKKSAVAPAIDTNKLQQDAWGDGHATGHLDGLREGFTKGVDQTWAFFKAHITTHGRHLSEALGELVAWDEKDKPRFAADDLGHSQGRAPPAPATPPATRSAPPPQRQSSATPADGALGKGPTALLIALAQLSRKHGPHMFTPAKVGILGGFSPGSSTFREYMRQLVAAGMVHRHSDGFQILPDGDKRAGVLVGIPSGRDLVEYWAGKVGKGPGAILRAVADAGMKASAEHIAGVAGFTVTSSTWREYTRQLRALSLIRGKDVLELGEAFS